MQNEVSVPAEKDRPKNLLKSWFDPRRKRAGSLAFALNRLTGLGLTAYLFIHLGVLTILLQGESAWDEFISIVKSPFFLFMDVVLIFGLLFHALNGLRLGLVGLGFAADNQKTLFWGLMGVGLIILIVAAVLVFTV